MARHPGWVLAGLLVLMIPLTFAIRRTGARADAPNVPQATRPGYATSDRCEACHPSQYASWHRGYHRTMTTYASPGTVKGAFDNVRLSGGGYDVSLSKTGDSFFAEMIDPLWQYQVDFGQRQPGPGELPPRITRKISMVTGSHHMQAYWIASDVDNAQLSMPFTYLLEDRRWVPRGDVFLHPEEAGRHQIQVWNVSCIRCHATAGQPLAKTQPLASRVGEMGIACEQCHGPGEQHIAANHDPLRRYLLHLGDGVDATIVNPARLSALAGSQVCGQCHSLTDVTDDIETGEGKKYVPGADLHATQPLLSPLHPTPALDKKLADDPLYLKGYFWNDGTIRVSSRDYSGMIESKCMTGGQLGCTSCHSLHESDPVNLLAADKSGDGACAGCHRPIAANPAAHTHHAVGSVGSQCTNCHMPYTVYGLLKGIRNHRIESPRVTGRSGGDEKPNACNLCHVDRSLAWTADALARWYKQPVPPGLVDGNPAAVEWLLSGDAILRAIAAYQFGWVGAMTAAPVKRFVPYLVVALNDPYAAVRYVAGHALHAIDPTIAYDYLAPPEERKRVGDAILARWLAADPANATGAAAINARIIELVGKRDDTPVRAME